MVRDDRLKRLSSIPFFAAMDHRNLMDENGDIPIISRQPRSVRNKIKSDAHRIGKLYNKIFKSLQNSGPGYPVDKLLRDLCIEFTNRYASSGTMNQPISFNYMEPFCNIQFIEKSIAPYAIPRNEYHHLFSVVDYFDFVTSKESSVFKFSDLFNLPEDTIYHFTQNGSVLDFTYSNKSGNEFVISGFSMIRHGCSLHWYMIAGEINETKEEEIESNCEEFNIENTPVHKRKFISEVMGENGNSRGTKIILDGTQNGHVTIFAGEFDIISENHLSRYLAKDFENSYSISTDDPYAVFHLEKGMKETVRTDMLDRLESASIMWDIAQTFFQIKYYFEYRLTINKEFIKNGKINLPRSAGAKAAFKYRYQNVSSIHISASSQVIPQNALIRYTPRPIKIEIEGYWRKIDPKFYGKDKHGNVVKGRDWVKADVSWKARPLLEDTVFVKSSISSARTTIDDYIKAVNSQKTPATEERNVLYILECSAMRDEIYKVGWTSKTAEDRAKELSSTTGIPVPFRVVKYWRHFSPSEIENRVHAMLAPYRINNSREFFKISLSILESIIESEIKRANKST